MDIQFVCESTAVLAHYIAKYQTKGPKSSFDEFHAEQMCDKSQFSKLLSLAMTLMKNREMGIMEATNYLLANSPYTTSERFQYLNCRFVSNRKKTLKFGKFLHGLSDDSTDIYFGNWVTSWYPNRPDGLEELTLHDFAGKHVRIDKTTANNRKDKSRLLNLKNNAGFMLKLEPTAKYRYDTIVYGPTLDPKKQTEEFYYSHIMLHVPWSDESKLIGDCSTYKERYNELKKVYPKLETSVRRVLDRKHLEEEVNKKVRFVSLDSRF